MGDEQSKETRSLAELAADKGLPQPFSVDYENEFEKNLYYAINLLRTNPKYFVSICDQAKKKTKIKSMFDGLTDKLKKTAPMNCVKYDDQANNACRIINADVV